VDLIQQGKGLEVS